MVIGGYRLLRLLGAGAMGRVYLAEHERLGRRAAVKVLDGWDPELVSRLFCEARAVAQIGDEHLVDVYDFVAEGIAVHNSIEQDADVVILLHRDRSDPERDGEADVIVAKHRNGPTKDIVLAFQGHYSRFNNMAREGGF